MVTSYIISPPKSCLTENYFSFFLTKTYVVGTHLSTSYICVIVRPVKRDWAVLSKDTPMDISIKNRKTECIYSPVKHFTAVYLYIHVYTCSSFEAS